MKKLIPESTKKEIYKRIQQAEHEHKIKVLYAVESGSRAWGFSSINSDFDVRFIYVHSKDWYLSVHLESKRDVIEYPIVDEIDISGWDLRKALQLFRKSNPSIIEWLQSPIIYLDDNQFAPYLKEKMKKYYSSTKGIYHYRSMAKTNYRGYLRKESVPLKKYFYVLRPLLAILWIEKYNQAAPIEFSTLKKMIHHNAIIGNVIEELLEQKKKSKEKEYIKAIPVLNDFIESELARLENLNLNTNNWVDEKDSLDDFFRSFL